MRIVMLILALGLLMGCGEEEPTCIMKEPPANPRDSGNTEVDSQETDAEESNPDEVGNPCLFAIPATFKSVEQFEVGLGPDGEVMGHWFLEFNESELVWSYSDISSTQPYTCEGNQVSTGEARGLYDATNETMEWDGILYALEP